MLSRMVIPLSTAYIWVAPASLLCQYLWVQIFCVLLRDIKSIAIYAMCRLNLFFQKVVCQRRLWMWHNVVRRLSEFYKEKVLHSCRAQHVVFQYKLTVSHSDFILHPLSLTIFSRGHQFLFLFFYVYMNKIRWYQCEWRMVYMKIDDWNGIFYWIRSKAWLHPHPDNYIVYI